MIMKRKNVKTQNMNAQSLDELKPGATVRVEIGSKPDFSSDNWYKFLSGAGLAVGVFNSLKK